MIYEISANKLEGNIEVVTSKSLTHRALICAALSKGKSVISNIYFSEDILATIDFIKSIGAEVEINTNNAIIKGFCNSKKTSYNSSESASTLRFSIPIIKYLFDEFTINCSDSLIKRPIDIYEQIYNQKIDKNNNEIKVKKGEFTNKIEIDGSISSQFISGILFVAPLLNKEVTITITNDFTSKQYVMMTIDIMKKFNINIELINNTIKIKKEQKYINTNYTVECDMSQASFFLIANKLKANVNIKNLINIDSTIQTDGLLSYNIDTDKNIIDLKDNPDLLPILSIYAVRNKTIEFRNINRLKFKESNRVLAVKEMIEAVNGEVEVLDNSIIIKKSNNLTNGKVNTYNDHRILMSAAILSFVANITVTVNEIQSINKSYKKFFKDFELLGGQVKQI